MYWTEILDNPVALGCLVGIIAIITGGITSIVRMYIKHQERMAMIERGMHPDHPDDDREC